MRIYIFILVIVLLLLILNYSNKEHFKDNNISATSCDCDYLTNMNEDWKKKANVYSENLNTCLANQYNINNFISKAVKNQNEQIEKNYNLMENNYKEQINILTNKYNALVNQMGGTTSNDNPAKEQLNDLKNGFVNGFKNNLIDDEENTNENGAQDMNIESENTGGSVDNYGAGKNQFGFYP